VSAGRGAAVLVVAASVAAVVALVVASVAASSGSLAAREAEVEDPQAPVLADQGVLGLEVAVDEAGLVGGGEAASGLQEHGDDLGPRPRLTQPLAQGLAAHELHGEEDLVAGLADLVDVDDVRVREPGEGLGLAEEGGAGPGVAARVVHELDGDLAVELLVVGGEDHAHAAVAEQLEQGVAADPARLSEPRERGVGAVGVAERRGRPVHRRIRGRCPDRRERHRAPSLTRCARPGSRAAASSPIQ
jgi:hypothetical protein